MIPTRRFGCGQTESRLEELLAQGSFRGVDRGAFLFDLPGRSVRFEPPAVQELPPGVETPGAYLEKIDDDLGVRLVLLVQAGAAALGVLDDGELERHKTIRKYMVRGSGRYQGTHLRTKGKSRYGSRLRLRNAISFFEEINERASAWDDELGGFDAVHYSCPVRLWAELTRSRVPPPFEPRDERLRRIPMGVRPPSHAELRRIVFELTHGRVEERDAGS